MKNTIKFYSIIENLVPQYVKEEFPLVVEFLSQYYKSQENKSAALDIIHNIDKYVQIDNVTDLNATTILTYPLEFENEIFIESNQSLPKNYGLIKIDNEIIWYDRLIEDVSETIECTIEVGSTSFVSENIKNELNRSAVDSENPWIGKIILIKDANGNIVSSAKIISIDSGLSVSIDLPLIPNADVSYYNSNNSYTCEINGNKLINCTRGFSAVTAYDSDNTTDELVYEETSFDTHILGSSVKNLSIIFLTEFFKKIKIQLTPGFEDEEFYEKINESNFIRNIKQFYSSKGTDCSFELLFRALFGEDISIVRPRDFVIQASDAQYNVFRDLVVEELEGDPQELENLTLYQDEFFNVPKAKGTVAKVEKIQRGGNFYYVISLDQTKEFNYDSNMGRFSIHPKTKSTNKILIGSDFIDVDSTIGFPESGELRIKTIQGQNFQVSYGSKTSTQFLNCVGIVQDIEIASIVRLDTFAYGYNGSNQIKVNIGGILSSLNIESYPYYSSLNESIRIKTLGENINDIRAENWFYNISTKYDIKNILIEDSSDFTYKIEVYDENILKIGDPVSLLYSLGQSKNGIVVGVDNPKTFIVRGFGPIDTDIKYILRKNISKVESLNFPELQKYSTNVQNVYIDENKKIFVNSQSLPNYLFEPLLITDRSVSFSGSYSNSEIINANSHGFYTGDSIVYEPIDEENSLNIPKGIYFAYVIDTNTIKIARSRENIFTQNFIKVSGEISNNKFTLKSFNTKELSNKKLLPQNIFREISQPTSPSQKESTETAPGTIGIFVNGVELLNYKSKDVIFYGGIEEVFPTAYGKGYDIINPPNFSIEDSTGSGASGYVSIKGFLDRFDIIDGGFDYIETPTIIINGGNGKDASVSANLVSFDYSAPFNASSGINTVSDTIGFSTYHRFRKNEVVFYDPTGQTKISGLSTNSQYYVSVINPFTIKLHSNFEDCSAGINTVNLIGIGTGRQSFKSLIKKKKIGSIQVINPGYGYENKKRTITPIGISTFSNAINIANHGYSSGEIIKYQNTQTSIGGLISGTSYYVTKVNNDKFKLSQISIATSQKDYFYSIKEYINFTSSGLGTHTFNYEPITIEVIGKSGIGSTYSELPQLRPIFTGEITSVYLESEGNSYGSEIINYKKQPNIFLLSGKNAQVSPVIKDGKILEVIIKNSGVEYYSTPKIEIIGNGSGAVLTPVIENNYLKKVKVVSSGGGYGEGTIINVIPAGSGAKFEAKIQSWRINLFERLFRNNQLPPDDGVLYEGKNDKNGLEYTHLYAARKLRSSVLGTRSLNGNLIYNSDLEILNGVESDSLTHSPIIGWSYDGNPIYGPYGYSSQIGGSVKQMVTGYELNGNQNQNRPNYPIGTFIEDYQFAGYGDLDEHNGRFCITPEFPNGVYAYFSTFDTGLPQSSGPFLNYKKPTFPYVIGNTYESSAIEFNFAPTSNLNKVNANDTSLLRNTKPYGLLNNNTYYEYITNPNKIKNQISKIKSLSYGAVESIGIVTGGNGYSIGDKILLSDSDVKAFVSQIKGKKVNQISVATTSVFDVEFIKDFDSYLGFSSVPHNLSANDLINITSSYDYNLFGRITVENHTLRLNSGIESSSITGIVTYLSVSGSLDSSKIRENDVYSLGSEKIKILNIIPEKSQIRILRNQNGTVGISSILVGVALTENSRKFKINLGISTSYNFRYNSELYFDPAVSVGLGTTSGVGITSTLFLEVINFNHPVSIGTGSTTFLYFNDIRDLQNYTDGGYVDIVNSSNIAFNTSKRKIVSIGNTSIGINFDTSSLSGIGVTAYINKWQIKTIPTRAIYLPNHKFNTGDILTYHTNGGNSIGISTNGISTFSISNNSNVYVAKISNDLIGISTFKVGLGTLGEYVGIGTTTTSSGILYFTSVGTGNTHSFVTNYNDIFVGDVSKNVVTVETFENSGLNRNDSIELSVKSGISTTVIVKYNKAHRTLVADQIDFISSNVNTNNNTITLYNHKLKIGQKIIHTSSSPVGGLIDNKIYYVIVISGSKIRLAETYYDSIKSNPSYINLTSASFGTISKINPPINVIKNSEIIFDLSDSSLSFISGSKSYSAFRLDFYIDKEFKNKYESSSNTRVFDVVRFGNVGIDSTASTTLKSENIPNNLYYKLTPINVKINSKENLEAIVDSDVINNNSIIISESLYNGNQIVVGISSTTFNYHLSTIPEVLKYTSEDSNIDYYVNSSQANGEIVKIDVISSGKNLKSLPKINSINTISGRDAILYAEGRNIGKVKENNIEIVDIGFDYSSDYSIRPTGRFSSLFEIESFSSLDKVSVTSPGKKYSIKPDLILFDVYRNKIIDDVDLQYNIQNHTTNIIKNTNTLSNYPPKIIPTNNSNGVGISSISYNSGNKTVTVGLAKSYSDINDFPFQVNDEVFIENVSIGIGSTLRGYNSSEYNYAFFTITSRDPNIGGSGGTITYSMEEFLNNGENLGIYNLINSSGKIINKNLLPTFEIKTKKKIFYKNEKIKSQNLEAIVEFHDVDRNIIKVSTVDEFSIGDTIRGLSSNSVASIKKIEEFKVNYNVSESSLANKGWQKETGFLNYNTQRIHDSDYYQYFSYSVQSKVSYEKWNESVSNLVHTSGFKKFSDLIVDSNAQSVGMVKDQLGSDISGISDISNIVSLNCYYDFDLVRENNINIDYNTGSNEVVFNSKIVQDYIESIGNRVLIIDDISSEFNNNPRSIAYSIVDNFLIADFRFKKYLFSVVDKVTNDYVEVGLVSLLNDGTFGYLNQYAFLPTLDYLSSFDFSISSGFGELRFYPYKFSENSYDVNLLSVNLPETITGIGSTNIGNIANISSNYISVSTANTSIIANIPSTYRSAKVLVQIGSTNSSYYEITELNVLNDGVSANILDYGTLSTRSSNSYSGGVGIGNYSARISGGNLIIEIDPVNGYGSNININTFVSSISNNLLTGVGTFAYSSGSINSKLKVISSSPTPTAQVISTFDTESNGAYYFVSIEDTTNSRYQTSEIVVVRNSTDSNITEFGVIYSSNSLGEFSTDIASPNCRLLFTPISNISVEVRALEFLISNLDSSKENELNFENDSTITFSNEEYTGTNIDIKKSFDLKHKGNPIFKTPFSANSSSIVDIDSNTINIPYHFFVTGEKVEYSYNQSNVSTQNAIGIATTSITGIGNTNKLPTTLYIVKVNDSKVKVSASSSEALSTIPNTLNLTSIGIGSNHSFISKKQNSKCIISIDNTLQSPIISTGTTTGLTTSLSKTNYYLSVENPNNFYGGDLIKINDEIMKINSVGIGSTNILLVTRPILGTKVQVHNQYAQVTKIIGNYNILENTIYFTDAPYGNVLEQNPNNRPDENDYFNLKTSSKFNGRVFLRSGIENSIFEPYEQNYIFDDISPNFSGITTQFSLTSDSSNITGISTSNAIILLNNVFQFPNKTTVPTIENQYFLTENSGITSISFFEDFSNNYEYDINLNELPRGGIILSVASTGGFAYQPLVAAGGTAVVSSAGTIQSISIGNSGSGYRVGIQTIINVGVATSSTGVPNIQFIGTAIVSGGSIVSVAITNPGVGYTSSNPPVVIFDSPLSYYNLPLVYNYSSSGIGTGARINIVVGQGSSVVNFEISNYGFGYQIGDVLTVESGGVAGIPTNTSLSFKEFQLVVDKTYNDSFSGWSVGDLKVLDSIEDLIDGQRKLFPIKIDGQQTSIRSKKLTKDEVQATLLIFINDILQVPNEGYIFNGGSVIEFIEPPKIDSTTNEKDSIKILFYKGTSDNDVLNVDILEQVEIGDTININSSNILLDQDERLVEQIINSDLITTNSYFGTGISSDVTIKRPITLCKQTEDRFVNGSYVAKDRNLYEPLIFPTTNIIQNVSTSSTTIFVENIKTFFDNGKEYVQNGTDNIPQKSFKILSQDSLVSSSATAVVSTSGTITSIIILDGGVGYTTSPSVIIQNPVGFGTTVGIGFISLVSSTISVGGTVSSINIINSGFGYSQETPPIVIIEPPTLTYEDITNATYEGDFGIVVGIATTSVAGIAQTGIVFDLFVPSSSYIRNSSINVGVSSTSTSGIQTGYLFVISNSNIGNGVTALNSSNSVVGIGSTFLDNIYSVAIVSTAQTSVPGVGVTYVSRVTVSVQSYNGLSGIGYSQFFGNYCWGRISGMTRKNPQSFVANINGYSGISTSPVIIRSKPLKYIGYSTT